LLNARGLNSRVAFLHRFLRPLYKGGMTTHTPAPPPPSEPPSQPQAQPQPQPRNALHGITLEAMVTALSTQYGWDGLAERIPLRCFSSNPSVRSSLKFLRSTPWAREKVESLYLFMLREARRNA
jgi:DNA-binding protein VF530